MLKHTRAMVIFILAFCLGLSVMLFAATTGKISGRVTDVNSGNPLAGVNVIIEGTSWGAATDAEGDYFIINVPPGTYTLQARMIGYTTQSQTGVGVSVDRTTTVNVRLQQTVLEGQEVTVVAEREIVPMDVSASQVVATAEEIIEIPLVQDIGEFLNLQVGIEDDMIRGGGLDGAGFMMDGLLVVDNRTNSPIMAVNLSAIQELNVIKGGFNAEYGNVRTGLINVVTKEGDVQKYNGSVDFRFTPAYQKHGGENLFDPENFWLKPYLDPAVCYVGTANGTWDAYTQQQNLLFQGWNSVSQKSLEDIDPTNDQTPDEARDRFIWLTRAHAKSEWDVPGANALLQKYGSSLSEYQSLYGRDSHETTYGDKPDINLDVSLSGPVPFIGKYLGHLNFFTSYRANWDAWGSPIGHNSSYFFEQNLQQKLTTRLSGSMKLTLEALYGEIRTFGRSNNGLSESNYYRSGGSNSGGGTSAYYPAYYPPFDVYRSMIGVSFDHVISPSTFYTVRISNLRTANTEYGSLYPDPELGRVVYDDSYWTGDVPLRDTTPIMNFGAVEMDEAPYGLYYHSVKLMDNGAYYGSHGAGARDLGRGVSFNMKFDLTSQVDKYNQVKTGFDFTYDDIYTFYEQIRFEAPEEEKNVEYSHYPYRLGAYLQDKLEFEGMIANIGLRLDYNQPNCDWYDVDRYSPYFTVDYKNVFLTEAPKQPAKGHLKISPRLGVSHPISSNAKLYFNYGHFYSMPGTETMYRIYWGRVTDGVLGIGNPNLDLPQTVAYELGLDYDIRNMYLLHVAGYYRDITDQTGSVSYINYDESVDYSTYENRNYQDTRGFEIRMDKRYGAWWTAWAQFNYMISTSGYIGRTTYFEDPNRQRTEGLDNPQLNRPVARPSARANLRFTTPSDFGPTWAGINPIGDFSINFLFSWQSGRVTTYDPLETLELQNNLKWKADYRLDLRISKRFRIAGLNFNLFADIQNLLDSELWSTGAFETSDDQDLYLKSLHLPMYAAKEYQDAGYPDDGYTGEMNDKPGDLRSDDKPYINDPNMNYRMYTDVRHVILGIAIDF